MSACPVETLSRIVSTLLSRLSLDQVDAWIDHPQVQFGGLSPAQLIRLGRTDEVLRCAERVAQRVARTV